MAEPWFTKYERDVRGVPGLPWPTKPRTAPRPPRQAVPKLRDRLHGMTRRRPR